MLFEKDVFWMFTLCVPVAAAGVRSWTPSLVLVPEIVPPEIAALIVPDVLLKRAPKSKLLLTVSLVSFTLPVPCTYDLEVAATKYLDALPDGEVPLSFHFNGRIFYRGEGGRLQVVMVPWVSAAFRLPVATWRGMMDRHYPGAGWIRVQDETLRRLQLRKAERGLPTFDAAVGDLLGSSLMTF